MPKHTSSEQLKNAIKKHGKGATVRSVLKSNPAKQIVSGSGGAPLGGFGGGKANLNDPTGRKRLKF